MSHKHGKRQKKDLSETIRESVCIESVDESYKLNRPLFWSIANESVLRYRPSDALDVPASILDQDCTYYFKSIYTLPYAKYTMLLRVSLAFMSPTNKTLYAAVPNTMRPCGKHPLVDENCVWRTQGALCELVYPNGRRRVCGKFYPMSPSRYLDPVMYHDPVDKKKKVESIVRSLHVKHRMRFLPIHRVDRILMVRRCSVPQLMMYLRMIPLDLMKLVYHYAYAPAEDVHELDFTHQKTHKTEMCMFNGHDKCTSCTTDVNSIGSQLYPRCAVAYSRPEIEGYWCGTCKPDACVLGYHASCATCRSLHDQQAVCSWSPESGSLYPDEVTRKPLCHPTLMRETNPLDNQDTISVDSNEFSDKDQEDDPTTFQVPTWAWF